MDAFEQEARRAARNMRRLVPALRKELAAEVRKTVADPLAEDIKASLDGPYRRVLVGGVKTRVQTDPMIVVGGARKVLSGGASVRDVVFGDEFGGGSRMGTVKASRSARSYQRRTTRQFYGKARGNILGTIRRQSDVTFDRWADVVEKIIKGGMDRG